MKHDLAHSLESYTDLEKFNEVKEQIKQMPTLEGNEMRFKAVQEKAKE